MAATIAERTYLVMKNFMRLHEQGYSIPEIAQRYSLTSRTVYYHLQEIADENNTTREALLRLVRTKKGEREWEREARKVKIDATEMQQEFETSIEAIDRLANQIEEIVKKEEV